MVEGSMCVKVPHLANNLMSNIVRASSMVLLAGVALLLVGASVQAWTGSDGTYEALDDLEPGGPVLSMTPMSGATVVTLSGNNTPGSTTPVYVSGSVAVPLPAGWSGGGFTFYGATYSTVYINNNGFISFLSVMGTAKDQALAQNLAGGKPTNPNGLVAGCWMDYKASDADGGQVSYLVTGTPPNRVFVIDFANVAHDQASPISPLASSFQIKLFETDDSIEVHIPANGCPPNNNSDNNLPGAPKYDLAYASGIEDAGGADGIAYRFCACLVESRAVRYFIDNDPPDAVDDVATLLEDGSQTIAVLATDSDPDGDPITLDGFDAVGSKGGTVARDDSGTPADLTDDKLTYTPPANYSGTDSFNYTISDPMGHEVNATVNVTVKPVNDEPDFTPGSSVTVLEDSGAYTGTAWATMETGGGTYESSQAVSVVVSSVSDASLFSSAPTIASDGKLTFTPADNATGTATITAHAKDDGGTLDGGDDTGPDKTFTITITAVNDVPSFTPGLDVEVLEDAVPYSAVWATAVSPGGGTYEASQTLTFDVTVDDPSLFSTGPSIDVAGTLTFTPAADKNGQTDVHVFLKDSGGTASGGVNESTTKTFTIKIKPVNDEPDVTPGPNVSVNEGTGAVTKSAWLGSTSTGGGTDEATQVVSVKVVSVSPGGGFTAGPAIDSSGTLTFTLDPDAGGTFTVTIRAEDDGGIADGGDDAGPDRTFTIDVAAVNDAPSFTSGLDVEVLEDAVPYSAVWATDVSPGGGADEASQTLTFDVTVDDPTLFSTGPSIDAAGKLMFTPAADKNGQTDVHVFLKDSGGTASGGVDESPSVTFTIVVKPVNDAPLVVKGPNVVVPASGALETKPGWATGIGPGGGSDEATQQLSFVLTPQDPSLFAGPLTLDPATGDLVVRPALGVAGATIVDGVLMDDGGIADGGVDSTTFSFLVGVGQELAPPQADFIATGEGLAVRFLDRSSDPDSAIVAWSWDFGDGSVSSEPSPWHAFDSYGHKVVELTVWDETGLMDSHAVVVTVAPFEPPGVAPAPPIVTEEPVIVPEEPTTEDMVLVADAGSDLVVASGAMFRLDGTGSSGPPGVVLDGMWTQLAGPATGGGEGLQLDLVAPPGPARLVFRLVVSDGNATDDDEVVVEVAAPVASFPASQPLVFTATEEAPRTWVFEAETVVLWQFGDGSSAEGMQVTHTYADEGAYRVVARGPDGLAERTVEVVTASPAPVDPVSVREPVLEATVPGKEAPEAAIFALAALNVVGVIVLAVVASRRRVR